MSSIGTASIIVIALGILISVVIIIQNIENHRQQNRVRMQSIRNNIRHVEQLYNALPQRLISEPLHHFISQHLLSQWRKLMLLDNTPSSQKAAEQSLHRLSNFSPDNTYPTGSLTLLNTKTEAQQAAQATRELAQWLKTLKNSGIAAQVLHDTASHLQLCHSQANIDWMIFDAIEYEHTKGAKASIHQYNNCLNSLNNMQHSQKHDRQVFELNCHIEALSSPSDEAT